MYILDLPPTHPWTPTQAWQLITLLAHTPSLRYNELLQHDLLKTSPDSTLQSLETAELISIVSINGRPSAIKPGKPVYKAAFEKLVADEALAARMDLEVLAQLIGVESRTIEKCEAELGLLGGFPGRPGEVRPRVEWLLRKLGGSQAKVEGYERDGVRLKKVLGRVF